MNNWFKDILLGAIGSIVAAIIISFAHKYLNITYISFKIFLSWSFYKFLISLSLGLILLKLIYIIKITPLLRYNEFDQYQNLLKLSCNEFCYISVIILVLKWLQLAIHNESIIIYNQIFKHYYLLIPVLFSICIGFYKYFELIEIIRGLNLQENEEMLIKYQKKSNMMGLFYFTLATFFILIIN
ncbi:hypothetical protein JXQ31_01315 [candidate division KSB1 bacterium]|nr:hypothetical protein [candidate division KSB1 bacterium]